MNESAEAAAERVDAHFRLHYNSELTEYEITDTPGYWRKLQPCTGRGTCRSMMSHGALGWEGPARHTAIYFDPPRDPETGRWASPYRTWQELHNTRRA